MPKASSAKAAEVNVPAPANTGKAYTGEKIMKPLDSGGGSGIMKSIDVDDFMLMASSYEIKSDISDMIVNTIREYEKKAACIFLICILVISLTRIREILH